MPQDIFLFDTLTKQKQQIKTLKADELKMYVCGPTVYDDVHIGNARSFVFYDLLFRIFKASFESVVYVRNITDVDDKIIARAKLSGKLEAEVSGSAIESFANACKFLNCLKPSHEPKVTEHLQEIISLIQSLIDNGHAYEADGDVFFKVSSFKEYGRLANRRLEDMLAGARIEVSQNKQNAEDFVLWKKTNPEDGVCFNSPFSRGRPGWHIECSAMAQKYLGDNFDIHGGGVDLQFPHHENEIAQSKCGFKGSSHATYWVHNGFLMVGGQKMSKSLGNFVTVKDIEASGIHGEVLRLALLSTHYTKPLDFSDALLFSTKKILSRFYSLISPELIAKHNAEGGFLPSIEALAEPLRECILEDVNISKYLAIMHSIARDIANTKDETEKQRLTLELFFAGRLLGVFYDPNYTQNQENIIDGDNYNKALELANQRAESKKMKDFKQSDALREQVKNLGFNIIDGDNYTFRLESLTN